MIWLAVIMTLFYVLATAVVLATPDLSTVRQRIGRYLFGTAGMVVLWVSTYGYYHLRIPA